MRAPPLRDVPGVVKRQAELELAGTECQRSVAAFSNQLLATEAQVHARLDSELQYTTLVRALPPWAARSGEIRRDPLPRV